MEKMPYRPELDVKDVRFPTWGAALSCIIQFSYPREGMVNDALMLAMGAPWLNTLMDTRMSKACFIRACPTIHSTNWHDDR